METLFHSPLFSWVILPLLIFMARIIDVSAGTLRIIFVSKGLKGIASVLGFFEALIWLIATGQIIQNLNNVMAYIAYGGGFAMGNFVGIYLEERLAMGILVVRMITEKDTTSLIEALTQEGYGVTAVDAQGSKGPVKLIYTIIKRKNLQNVVSIIEEHTPKAFYSIEDTRRAYEGIFPSPIERTGIRSNRLNRLKLRKKVK